MNKIPGKIHWSSSPDRGLDNLLYLLPWIQERTSIKLHVDVYYGFENISKMNPGLATELERLIKIAGDEVCRFKGRVGQSELAEFWKKAHVWIYPTAFTETFCLTACEAMLSNTPILCSNLAALESTVGDYGIRVDGHAYSKESRVKFVDEAVKLFNDKSHWEYWSMRSSMGGKRGVDWDTRWKEYWEPLFNES